MGITLVEKSDPLFSKDNPKIALVLAGGAISGGAFKVGGLKALNDYFVNKKVTDFDIYVGISAGSFLAAPLAGGIPPEEMLASLDGKSKLFSQLSPLQMYRPNFSEFFLRPLQYLYGHLTFVPGILYDLLMAYPNLKDDFVTNVKDLLNSPNYSNYEKLISPFLRIIYASRTLPHLGEMFPSGLFDNAPLEKFIRMNMKQNRMSNHFKVLKRMSGKSLYISSMELDSARSVIFGPDEKNDVTISQAIQASTAIPGFYKPARIKGVDYLDGGVEKTANLDIAFQKGADLVICYNPFRPFNNEVVVEYLREENRYFSKKKRLSDLGLGVIFNQVFRTLFHTRLMQTIQAYQEDHLFRKDIILIEPQEDDSEFFQLNPILIWNRAKAAAQGYQSVFHSIRNKFHRIEAIVKKYGITMSDNLANRDEAILEKSHFDPKVVMATLEKQSPRHLRIVNGNV